MALDFTAIVQAAESHALATGLFEQVNRHEPKSAPGSGVRASIWAQRIGPAPNVSGLATTTARLELRVRLYTNMLAEPQDEIDPAVMAALDALLTAYSGDYTLGGLVKEVDLLGAQGEPLGAQAGYLRQDGRLYRVMDITLPLIVNDAWAQAA